MKAPLTHQQLQQNLDHIGLYNVKVAKYLKENPLTPLLQERIKHFKNNAQKNKLSDAAYNKAVEEFNALGYFLPKKHVQFKSTEIDKNYNYINFPYIDTEAYRETMCNYRAYRKEYNNQVKEYNKTVKEYNTGITKVSSTKLLAEIKTFKETNNRLFTKNYNKKVAFFNDKKGCKYIKKRNLQTLKDVTELYFSVILGFYTKQLRNYTDTQLKLNLPTTIKKNGLKQVEIDHRKLATHKIKDVVRLEGCKRTLQNHVKRLREAGLLTHYVYSNQFNAIKVSINNKILVVLDGKLPKTQNTQNQIVKEMESKELHNNSDTIRTNLKEKEKKGDVFNIGSIISGSMLQSMKTMSADSYKNTEEKQTEKIKDQLAQKFNVNSKISFNARKIIIDNDKNFAEDLANKVYDKYTVLRYDRLLKLIQYSDLSANEIKKLLTQDIIKQSAKIWKDHNVYVGEWKKTINVLTGNLFKNMVQKETMLQKHREYRWKINFARQWFLKNKQIKALFPYKYFDSTRKTTKEVGFYGLHYAWKSHINYSIKKSQQIKQQKLDAETRKRKISSDKKFQNILQKYFTGKIDFIKMYDYIKNNIPEYMKKLEEKFKNYNQLTA